MRREMFSFDMVAKTRAQFINWERVRLDPEQTRGALRGSLFTQHDQEHA
jgi:hypothetical protein